MQQQTEAFIGEVRDATKMQSDDLRRRLRYDFVSRELEADWQLRELILNALDQSKGRIAPGEHPASSRPARRLPLAHQRGLIEWIIGKTRSRP